MINQKQQRLFIYNKEDEIVDSYEVFEFNSIKRVINSGVQSLQINLPFKADQILKNIEEGYRADIAVSSNEFNEKTIFSGEIQSIDGVISDLDQTGITCVGYMFQMATTLLEGASNEVLIKYDEAESSDVIKDIITKAQDSNSKFKIEYSADSIQATSQAFKKAFYISSIKKGVDEVISELPGTWFSFLDTNNIYHLKQVNTEIDHFLTIGTNCADLSFSRGLQNTITDILFTNGIVKADPRAILKKYTASIASDYSQRYQVINDSRVFLESKANDRANRELDKVGKITNTYSVLFFNPINSYKDIQVGDTVAFNNIAADSKIEEEDSYVITEIDDDIDTYRLTLASTTDFISKQTALNSISIDEMQLQPGMPTKYTT